MQFLGQNKKVLRFSRLYNPGQNKVVLKGFLAMQYPGQNEKV